jgi:hypothetical protein
MTTQANEQESAHDPAGVAPPQGHIRGVPYDVRRPTVERAKSRLWNRHDPRFFPPKGFGAGWTINVYWLFHLAAYVKGRGAPS